MNPGNPLPLTATVKVARKVGLW